MMEELIDEAIAIAAKAPVANRLEELAVGSSWAILIAFKEGEDSLMVSSTMYPANVDNMTAHGLLDRAHKHICDRLADGE